MKTKRILALAGVAVLALLYIITLISAIFTSAVTPQLFKACVLATFVVPIFLYGYLLIYRLMKERADDAKKELDESIRRGSGEAADSDETEDSDEAAGSSEAMSSDDPPVSP